MDFIDMLIESKPGFIENSTDVELDNDDQWDLDEHIEFDLYDWKYTDEFPVEILASYLQIFDKSNAEEYLEQESQMFPQWEDRDPSEYIQSLTSYWSKYNNRVDDPVLLILNQGGDLSQILDGHHRSVASIYIGLNAIPAFFGVRRND